MDRKIKDTLIDALKQQYLGAIATAKANVAVYLDNSVGIGEHPDITLAIDSQIELMAAAQEKLDILTSVYITPTQLNE